MSKGRFAFPGTIRWRQGPVPYATGSPISTSTETSTPARTLCVTRQKSSKISRHRDGEISPGRISAL